MMTIQNNKSFTFSYFYRILGSSGILGNCVRGFSCWASSFVGEMASFGGCSSYFGCS